MKSPSGTPDDESPAESNNQPLPTIASRLVLVNKLWRPRGANSNSAIFYVSSYVVRNTALIVS